MKSRREILTSVAGSVTILTGCTDSSGGSGGDDTDNNGDRPCEDAEGGCGSESAARLLEQYIQDNGGFDAEVEVDENFLSTDDLSVTHTTTGGSITGNSDSSEVLENISVIAYWFSAAVNDGFEVGNLSAEIIYSFSSPDPLGTYSIERDWAEQFLSGELTEDEYYTTVYENLET